MNKEEYAALLRDPRWQRRRLEVMQAADFKCARCGTGDVELNVHHKRYRNGRAPWEYVDEDLECLCRPCHESAHVTDGAKKLKKVPKSVAAARDTKANMLLDFVQIETPAEWRALLMGAAVAVLDGRVNISQANALVGLSVEVHKSLRQQWEMQCYVAENIVIDGGKVKRLDFIEGERDAT